MVAGFTVESGFYHTEIQKKCRFFFGGSNWSKICSISEMVK